MNAVSGAPYVGVSEGAVDAAALTPLHISEADIKSEAESEGSLANYVSRLNQEQKIKLTDYLKGRLAAGAMTRNNRAQRYAKIDRTISTWQKLDPDDSKREKIEDATGKQQALPFNLPVLASHLNDMVSYFAEAIAPISNPFFTTSGEAGITELAKKMNRDAQARDYYGELALTLRSLLKYNIGGFKIEWENAEAGGSTSAQSGNRWTHLDMYNTLWDPSIRNPRNVACKGEWAATVELTNRLDLMEKSLSGEWVGLESLLASNQHGQRKTIFYREPAVEAALGEQGMDSHTTSTTDRKIDWASYGLGLATDLGPEVDGFELVDMYCWIVPDQFGLLSEEEKAQIEGTDARSPKAFLELWRFKIVNDCLVDAVPLKPREDTIAGERPEIPIYLAYLTQDQLKEAQRSFMELMKGFQRFASNMYNIYIAGMRKNVWGIKGVDPQMFDPSPLKSGDTVGVLVSKTPGRDVRSGVIALDQSSGVENALGAVSQTLELKNQFFPSQALPSQIAGIDRAVKSQVATVIQGAQRTLRMLVRTLDSSLMLPTRLAAYRNLKKWDKTGIESLNDEEVAKVLGSGIESMESERIAEALWQLMYAIIQNQESMERFDVPDMLTYISRVQNLSVDLGRFYRQQQQPAVDPAQAEAAAAEAGVGEAQGVNPATFGMPT
jgi:hypothetical protein